MVFRPIEVLIGVTLLMAGGGLLAVAMLHAVIWIMQAVWSLFLVKNRLVKLQLSVSLRQFVGLKSSSALYWLVLLTTLMHQGPVVLFRHTIEDGLLLGQFALVMQLYLLLCAVPDAVARAALPILSRSALRGDGKDTLFMQGMIHVGIIVGAVVAITGFAFGPWIVPLVFGQEYEETGRLLGPALLLISPFTIYSAGMKVLIANGKYNQSLISSVFGALALVIGVPMMALEEGIIGAIVGVGIALSIAAVLMVAIQVKQYQLKLDNYLLITTGIALGAAAFYFALQSHYKVVAVFIAYSMLLLASIGTYFRFMKALK
jgi:O-antigen/teichoic acid export membrane protein